MKLYNFTVDAELLRELGASLVGRPHIALAEVIKNSYDADATRVEIDFSEEAITVVDNGHGMSENDFVTRWMRVGTTHKRDEQTSPWLHRTLTGSKGVGRLAVQLLADVVELTSVGLKDLEDPPTSGLHREMDATVEWNKAIAEGDLTDVQVPVYNSSPKMTFAGGSAHGTRVRLSELSEIWDETKFQELAEEIWSLQPPFDVDDERKFEIVLTSESEAISSAFNEQMQAIFDIWNAKIWGRLLPLGEEPSVPVAMTLPSNLPPSRDAEDDELDRLTDDGDSDADSETVVSAMDTRVDKVREALPDRYFEATVQLRGAKPRTVVWLIEHADIDEVGFEVRVFDLVRRQPKNLRVSEARKYLSRFGGVSIYDNGFRLPYYGASQDWLRMERDHAGRLTTSKLVPEGLKITRGLLDLPSNKRVFGWVSVSTTHEAQTRAELGISEVPGLAILLTRQWREKGIDMTDDAAETRGSKKGPPVRAVTYVAGGVSLATAIALWLTVIGLTGPEAYASTFGQLPNAVMNVIGALIYILPLGVLGSVILDVVAGTRRGANRIVALMGGFLVLSPGIAVLIPLLDSIPN